MGVLKILILIVFFVGLLYLRFKMPAIKGKIGERSVASILSLLPQNKYIVLNNILLKKGAYSTQIDHIIVSVYGIFVIETKNYKGWIFGNSFKSYWTQNIWGHKYSLYNPIIQNKNHINFLLKKYPELKEKANSIFSIIVFIRTSRLILSGKCENVIMLRELYAHIKSFSQNTISIDDCYKIASLLQTDNIEDKAERKAHIDTVKSAIISHELTSNQELCPSCGGHLVVRSGKYGHFWGCCNFPRCRYTRKK